MIEFLEKILSHAEGWTEIRYHDKIVNSMTIRNGELEESSSHQNRGVGIRVLIDGTLGFSSTSSVDEDSLIQALRDATVAARDASCAKTRKIEEFPAVELAKGRFELVINDPVTSHSLKEKLSLVKRIEEQVRTSSSLIGSAYCNYRESIDEKFVLTSDGARACIIDSKPEFRVTAVAVRNGEMQTEAIGHTVEADWVLAGSIVKDKVGQLVASELVTLADSGVSQISPNAGGIVLVDDEGVPAQRTVVIDNGVLRNYLHNRETAQVFGVMPTGNARAWSYSDEPIIRMRNTYIEPGDMEFEELISGVKNGYFLKGGKGGQADANAEFMFGVQEAYRITNGKVGELLRGVTISGQAFDVLKSCNGVGKEFKWGLGAGYCGKMQAAKVDAGGPHVRCKVIVGGVQGT
jgi:TldD protein